MARSCEGWASSPRSTRHDRGDAGALRHQPKHSIALPFMASGASRDAKATRRATSFGDIFGANPPIFAIGVSTDPGSTDIACNPEPRSSSARALVSPTAPHLDAQYAANPA